MADVTIKVRENGPLLVSGPIELVDHEGRTILVEAEKIALCRCGHSSRKPFCDATHRGVGFDGACAADVFA
jgi:3-phenylpropionate/trans-cinnamate dioxygenase ferredoxin subunit